VTRTLADVIAAAPYRVDFSEKPYRTYAIDGLKVPSVTKILGILDKPALVHWAQRTAVEGVCELAQQYGADDAVFRDADALAAALIDAGGACRLPEDWQVASADEALRRAAEMFVRVYEQQNCTLPFDRPGDVLRLVKSGEVDIKSRMNAAAARGTAVHSGWEHYAETGKFPDPMKQPEAYRGYFAALAKATVELRPRFHGSEVVVGSKRHRYGGRMDHLLTLRDETRRGILDLKTNAKGRVYPVEHGLQIAGYEGAVVEMGAPPPDFRAVLAVGENGNWELVETKATPEDFFALVPVQRRLDEIDKQAKKDERARKAQEGAK
jgi:hypothetical protein